MFLKLDNYLAKNYKKLKQIADKITSCKKYDNDDLLHDTIVALYDSDKKKIEKLIDKNELVFWIAKIMVNQYHSKTSPFYKKYRKYYEDKNENFVLGCWNDQYINNSPGRIHRIIEEDGVEKKKQLEKDIEKVNKKLKEIHWFDSEVFRIYYQMNFSLNKMEKETGINRNTLYKSIVKVKKVFNEK
jgi:predicted transcriptional regulator